MEKKKSKKGPVRNKFTPEEDKQLQELHDLYQDDWEKISSMMVNRSFRQVKDRWNNYLSPTINRSPFTEEEDNFLIEKYEEIGPKWSIMIQFFNNRTDASLKNRFQLLERKSLRGKEIVYESTENNSSENEEKIIETTPKIAAPEKFEFLMHQDDILKLWQDVYGIQDVMDEADRVFDLLNF